MPVVRVVGVGKGVAVVEVGRVAVRATATAPEEEAPTSLVKLIVIILLPLIRVSVFHVGVQHRSLLCSNVV